MENLPVNNGNGQSYGYTLYETAVGSSGGTLNAMNRVRDRALVRTGAGVAHARTVKSDLSSRTSRLAATVTLDKWLIFIFCTFPFVCLLPCQVFVDRQFVGVLDYETQELSLPEGKVTLPVTVSYYLYLYRMSVRLSGCHQKTFLALCLQSSAKMLGFAAKHVIVHMLRRWRQSTEPTLVRIF